MHVVLRDGIDVGIFLYFKVNVRFDQTTVRPGHEATVRVSAAPGSLCSVGVVDKSINLLAGNHQITPDKLYSMIPEARSWYSTHRQDIEYCDNKKEEDLAHLLQTTPEPEESTTLAEGMFVTLNDYTTQTIFY